MYAGVEEAKKLNHGCAATFEPRSPGGRENHIGHIGASEEHRFCALCASAVGFRVGTTLDLGTLPSRMPYLSLEVQRRLSPALWKYHGSSK